MEFLRRQTMMHGFGWLQEDRGEHEATPGKWDAAQASLAHLLGLATESSPHDLALALETQEEYLHQSAREGNPLAAQALVQLRLTYLSWAYGAQSGQLVRSRQEGQAC